MGIALDVASTEFHRDGAYHIDGQAIDSEGLADLYSGWLDEYPILSIEDGFDEDDWLGWSRFTAREGHRVQIVGDDLFVTQSERLARGIEMQAANAMLVKVTKWARSPRPSKRWTSLLGTVSTTSSAIAPVRPRT